MGIDKTIALLRLLLLPVLFFHDSDLFADSPVPRFEKVMIVVFENTDYAEALKQPGFAKLAEDGALLTNFHAETHPSQPNYLALVSGSTHGVNHDGKVDLNAPNLVDRLEAKGRSWKAYLEDYPGNCFLGEKSGDYVRKHNPFASFTNIQKLPERCSKMVPAKELKDDIDSRNLPDVSLYVPNMKNDGHDTGSAYASRWLTEKFLPALGHPLPPGLLLIVTFDESGSSKEGNRIYTVMVGAGVKAGARSAERYDHYSILRTIESRYGLESLHSNDANASEVTSVWK